MVTLCNCPPTPDTHKCPHPQHPSPLSVLLNGRRFSAPVPLRFSSPDLLKGTELAVCVTAESVGSSHKFHQDNEPELLFQATARGASLSVSPCAQSSHCLHQTTIKLYRQNHTFMFFNQMLASGMGQHDIMFNIKKSAVDCIKLYMSLLTSIMEIMVKL